MIPRKCSTFAKRLMKNMWMALDACSSSSGRTRASVGYGAATGRFPDSVDKLAETRPEWGPNEIRQPFD
jgi:hypothetical protein